MKTQLPSKYPWKSSRAPLGFASPRLRTPGVTERVNPTRVNMCVCFVWMPWFEMSLRGPVLSNYYVSKHLEPVRSFSVWRIKILPRLHRPYQIFSIVVRGTFPAVVSLCTHTPTVVPTQLPTHFEAKHEKGVGTPFPRVPAPLHSCSLKHNTTELFLFFYCT